MSDYDSEVTFDRDPQRYVGELWKCAQRWWETQRKRTQEQWDMFMGRDEFIKRRGDAGYSALSVPLTFVVSEARTSLLWEMLSAAEPFFRFEPLETNALFDRIRAERLESAFEAIRRDLEWDDKIVELFQATDIFDYAWIALELESLMITPQMGILGGEQLIGTEKLYPSWNVYAPGQVLIDGFYSREEQIPAKFKVAFMPYHQLKMAYPDKVGPWIKKHARPRDDSAFYNPAAVDENRKGNESVYVRWKNSGGGDNDGNRGFTVVEAHLTAMFSDGTPRPVIYSFLPDVTTGPEGSTKTFKWGMPLGDPQPKPYQTVRDMIWMARGRPLPFTSRGMGTADLLVPFQREFSDALSSERDLDRMYLAPPMAVRGELLIGKEKPSLNANEIWTFQDKDWSRQMALSDLAQPIITPTPNRGYLQNTGSKMQNLVDLIGAAMEAQTGEAPDVGRTATEFSGRTRGAARRITVVFAQHARTFQRIVRSMIAMMGETPDQFMYPPIRAKSGTLGESSYLDMQDIMGAVRVTVPALSDYANREMAKVMWRMTMEGLLQIPVIAQSPQVGLLLTEDIMRNQGVGEQRVQEYMSAATQGMQQAMMMQAMTALPQDVGGGSMPGPTNEIPGAGSMGPGRVSNIGNLQSGIGA
jgi:hypothetical protein